MYRIASSKAADNLCSSFPMHVFDFLFSAYLQWSAIWVTMNALDLFLILMNGFSFFSHLEYHWLQVFHMGQFFPWDVFYLYVQESNGGFCQSITAMITYLLFWVHLCGVLTCMCQFKYIELFWHPWDDINFIMINCFFYVLEFGFQFSLQNLCIHIH